MSTDGSDADKGAGTTATDAGGAVRLPGAAAGGKKRTTPPRQVPKPASKDGSAGGANGRPVKAGQRRPLRGPEPAPVGVLVAAAPRDASA
ncbi:hypothetical protein [Flexivirga alba]|uniref:Uncharacterized protein n=1 Tax=Flexivirga alba TaxID=702742 RepID=A0ABW2AE62_9MICO